MAQYVAIESVTYCEVICVKMSIFTQICNKKTPLVYQNET